MVTYDVVVVGLGGAGSSTVYHAARSGARTLGLEQFGPVHPHGSSHGSTRIYRTAYLEGPQYVPMVRRAQQLWFSLQEASGERIVRKTGGLMIGRPEGPTVAGSKATAAALSLEHAILSPSEVADRFPQFVLNESEVALWDPNAGVLFPETCIRVHSAGAVDAGAELHYGEAVQRWNADTEGVTVRTRAGEYRARSLVVTAGSWTAGVVADLALPLEIERQFMLWFPPTDLSTTGPERMPVFLWDRGPDEHTYGIPNFGDGVKVGSWRGKITPRPEAADREFHESDAAPIRGFVARCLRGVGARESTHTSCLYTNAPDRHFLIGRHPSHPRVVVISACSGHGFKFTSVIGEIAARLARHEEPGFDLTPFDPARFRPRPSTA